MVSSSKVARVKEIRIGVIVCIVDDGQELRKGQFAGLNEALRFYPSRLQITAVEQTKVGM